MAITDDLRRWVEAGLIDRQTADAIETFETERSQTARIGRGMEAVAYLATVLILVALGILAIQFWDRIEPWGRLVLTAMVALILLAVGPILSRSEEPAVKRAQTFSWFLAVAAVGLATHVVAGDIADLDSDTAFMWVALVSLVSAVVLWTLRSSVLQMVAMGVTAGASSVAVLSQVESAPEWSYGLAFAGLGLVWLLLTWGGVFQPARTSYTLAAIGVLLIAFPGGSDLPWPVLGLIAGLALMAVSVRLDESVLLGMGVVGLFVYIPMTIFEVFEETLGVPVALLLTGLILLGVVVVTVRLRDRARP